MCQTEIEKVNERIWLKGPAWIYFKYSELLYKLAGINCDKLMEERRIEHERKNAGMKMSGFIYLPYVPLTVVRCERLTAKEWMDARCERAVRVVSDGLPFTQIGSNNMFTFADSRASSKRFKERYAQKIVDPSYYGVVIVSKDAGR